MTQSAEKPIIRAYPQLTRPPEQFGYHKVCFELGLVGGYIIFYLSKDLVVTLLFTFILMTLLNSFLKKDPKFFEVRKAARKIHSASFGFFKAYSTPKQNIRTVVFK